MTKIKKTLILLLFFILVFLANTQADAILKRDLFNNSAKGFETFSYQAIKLDGKEEGRGIILKPGQHYLVHFDLQGPCAVYVSMITPNPAVTATWGDQVTRINANERFYYGSGKIFPNVATISASGELYGRNPAGDGEKVAQEFFAGAGEFKDGALELAVEKGEACLTKISVRPLSPEEYKLAKYRNNPTANKRIIYNNDGFSNGFGDPNWDYHDLLRQIDIYANSDAREIDWQPLVSGVVSYSSKYADFLGDGIDTWERQADRITAENYRKLEQNGTSLFPILVRRGEEIGVPVWGSLRMSAYYADAYANTFNGSLWKTHPEYRILTRAGKIQPQMSYAFEPVREQRLGVLTEMAEMGCQGVNLDFCRYPQILGYDEPLVSGFKEKYGISPYDLPEHDPRWTAYRCELMNQFMRDLRKRLAPIGQKRGMPVQVSVRLPAAGYEDYGFDPMTWIKEGLVDLLIVGWPSVDKPYDLSPWKKMVQGSSVQLYGNIERMIQVGEYFEPTDKQVRDGHKTGPMTFYRREDYIRRAARLYKEGADGIYIFNNFYENGVAQSLGFLGDREWVRRWSKFEDPANLQSEIVILSTMPSAS